MEDLLGRVGLKYTRYNEDRLAAEVARLCRPDLAYEDMEAMEKEMEAPPLVRGTLEESVYAGDIS